MMFIWFPLLFLVPIAIFWSAGPTVLRADSAPDDASSIARMRLARGEISVAQYEEIRRTIGV